MDGRSVEAAPPRTRRFTAGRFIKRHRRVILRSALAGALIVLIVALVGGLIPGVPGFSTYMQGLVETYASGERYGLPEGAWVNGINVNRAGGRYALVGGGEKNTAARDHAMVGGGFYNSASGTYATVGGGANNLAEGDFTTVAGGRTNRVMGHGSTIGGGEGNQVEGVRATIAGGEQNTNRGTWAVVGGGSGNSIFSQNATIGGGRLNRIGIDNGDRVEADGATIGGGIQNRARWRQSTIGGGLDNEATSSNSTVGGGRGNVAGTGEPNTGVGATVAGGIGNQATGSFAAIPGGQHNEAAGEGAFAAGTRARALHDGAFVWSDRTGEEEEEFVESTGPDSFTARARGGFRFLTNIDSGPELKAGEGGWSYLLSKASRSDDEAVAGSEIIEQIKGLEVETFRFAAQRTDDRHIAPTAESLRAALGIGGEDGQVLGSDLDGVALAAIQALLQRIETQQAALDEQAARIAELERRMTEG